MHSTDTFVQPKSSPIAGMIVLLMCHWNAKGVIYKKQLDGE